MVMLLSLAPMAMANSLGVGFNLSPDNELSLGIQGEYEHDNMDVEYQYQGFDFHNAEIDVAFRYSLGWIAGSVFTANKWSGYSLDEDGLTRKNDLGVSGIVPYKDLEFELSVFGRNGKNPVAPKKRYDPNTGEEVDATPGLTATQGTHFSVSTEFDINIFEIEVKGLYNPFEEDPTPQWLLDASTTGEIWKVDWTLAGSYRGQRHLGENESEFSALLTFGIEY